ncbi:phosphate regulon sensor protein PhoR [Pseudoalteromonas sp. Hal099]
MYRVINKQALVKRLFIYFTPVISWCAYWCTIFALFLGTSSLLVWHYHQLYRLSDWLLNQRSFNPPEGEGAWEQVFEGIYHLQHRNRKNAMNWPI